MWKKSIIEAKDAEEEEKKKKRIGGVGVEKVNEIYSKKEW